MKRRVNRVKGRVLCRVCRDAGMAKVIVNGRDVVKACRCDLGDQRANPPKQHANGKPTGYVALERMTIEEFRELAFA